MTLRTIAISSDDCDGDDDDYGDGFIITVAVTIY